MELDKERRVSSPVEQPEPPPSTQEEKSIPPGGRLVTVFFLIFGGVFLQQSLALWARDPAPSGSATFPLAISVLLLALTVVDFLQNLKRRSENQGKPLGQQAWDGLRHLFPRDSLIFLLMSIAYYALLIFGVPFLLASVLFLMGSMCYLIPHNVVKNAVYTAVLMAAIYAIFVLVFKVTLP